MHHFASFNNQFYRKSIEYMQSVVGHAAEQVVRRLSRSRRVLQRPLRAADQRADRHARGAGRAGVHVLPLRSRTSTARWATAASPSSIRRCTTWPRAGNRYIRAVDRLLTYLDPEPHRRTFMKPFMRLDSSEFCSTCHKVHLDVPVNDYRWIRGFNDYDNWQASGVSGQGARSFYYPPTSRRPASDCHMPLVPSDDPGRHRGRHGALASLPGGQHRRAVRQPRRRSS